MKRSYDYVINACNAATHGRYVPSNVASETVDRPPVAPRNAERSCRRVPASQPLSVRPPCALPIRDKGHAARYACQWTVVGAVAPLQRVRVNPVH